MQQVPGGQKRYFIFFPAYIHIFLSFILSFHFFFFLSPTNIDSTKIFKEDAHAD